MRIQRTASTNSPTPPRSKASNGMISAVAMARPLNGGPAPDPCDQESNPLTARGEVLGPAVDLLGQRLQHLVRLGVRFR